MYESLIHALMGQSARRRPREDEPGFDPYTMGNRRVGPGYHPDHTVLVPTAGAIKQFQGYHGLPRTGVVDARTRRKMRQTNTSMATGALGYGGPH